MKTVSGESGKRYRGLIYWVGNSTLHVVTELCEPAPLGYMYVLKSFNPTRWVGNDHFDAGMANSLSEDQGLASIRSDEIG